MAQDAEKIAAQAERLRDMKTRQRFKFREVAEAVDVTERQVQRWFAGDSDIDGDNLKALAKFLKTTPDFIEYGEERLKAPTPDLIPQLTTEDLSTRVAGLQRQHLLPLQLANDQRHLLMQFGKIVRFDGHQQLNPTGGQIDVGCRAERKRSDTSPRQRLKRSIGYLTKTVVRTLDRTGLQHHLMLDQRGKSRQKRGHLISHGRIVGNFASTVARQICSPARRNWLRVLGTVRRSLGVFATVTMCPRDGGTGTEKHLKCPDPDASHHHPAAQASCTIARNWRSAG